MYGASPKGTANQLTSGVLTKLRIITRNSLGLGTPSDPITLTPASRPGAPGAVIVTSYGDPDSGDFLDLAWDMPIDTGSNDKFTVPLTKYMLEVDEHFGLGFVPLIEFDADLDGPFAPTMAYRHQNLILGHAYSYRVKAKNLMGYGVYSSIAQ